MSSVAKTLSAALLAAGFAGCIATAAEADPIPYQQVGTYNDAIYSFTAAGTGDVTGYIVGGFGAGFTNEVGLLVNGVQTNAGFALNNHASSVGDSFDFGFVHAGDALTFVLENLTLQKDAYSDPTLNIAYDDPGYVGGHNHIYSAAYTATSPSFAGVPSGTYVAFEDLPLPGADFNYDDESFVFTNTTAHVPEPASIALLGVGMLGFAAIRRRRV
jgi:hypothetical protein